MRTLTSGLASAAFALAACSSDGNGPASPGPGETVSSVVVTPDAAELTSLGQSVTLSATARNTSGGVVAGRTFTWTSSNQAVAVVSPSGEVTSISNGTATITATTGTVSGSAQFRVEQAVARVRIQPDSTTLSAPSTVRLEAEGADAMDNRVAGATFDWRSSDESVAVVDPTGVVAGVSPGRAVISATSQGVAATGVVRVVPRIEFATVSADGHSCAVSSTGLGYCWGANSWGELGVAVSFSSQVPVPVQGGHVFRSISPGVRFTCGVTVSGEAFCWGRDEAGRLGRGTSPAPDQCSVPPNFNPEPCAKAPQLVAGGHRFQMVSAGHRHACGIALDGTAWCWGLNDRGQLGIGMTDGPATCTGPVACAPAPVPVAGGRTFESISVGLNHACAVTPIGDAYCWGSNLGATLGDGTSIPRHTPVRIAGGHRFATVTAGFNHTCGLTRTGTVHCWGVNQEGQLGVAGVMHHLVPMPVAGNLVFASADTRCGVTQAGAAYCWGPNRFGQLGIGTRMGPEQCMDSCSRRPVPVAGGLTFRAVSAGRSAQVHSCGVTTEGAVYCWGQNSSGALGNGSTMDSPAPVAIRLPE